LQKIANSEKVATFNPCPYFSFGSLMQAPCFLLAYDIQQPKNRRRALKKLRKVADFYQDSVFDARLLQRERHQLLLQLADCLQSGDSLFCVRLGRHCQSWQLGVGLEPLTDLGLVIS
jgi:CRISPR-associated endonuclease Cas2